MRADISKVGLGFVFSVLMLSSVAFAQGLQDVVNTLKEIGVFEFYLPFIIVFAILFGLLVKTKIFGDQRGIAIVIALAAAGFIMIYTPVGITFSQFLAQFVGGAVAVILTFVVLIVLVSMISTKEAGIFPEMWNDIFKGNMLWLLLAFILLIVVGVFISSGGTAIFPGLKIAPSQLFSSLGGLDITTLSIIILVVGLALIIFIFGRKPPTAQAGG